VPFIQNFANTGESEAEVADITAIFKYAFARHATGVVSGGLAMTLPSSDIPTVIVVENDSLDMVHPVLLQPFVGYRREWGRFFLQGLSSVMVPTDSRDAPFLFNDVGIGWTVPLDGALRAVVPVFEAHVNTPLDNRGLQGFADSLNLTAGSYFFLGDRVRVGAALGARGAGRKLYAFEAQANLNWRF
jgi:hypothetical protein